jgi:hypothetical protein
METAVLRWIYYVLLLGSVGGTSSILCKLHIDQTFGARARRYQVQLARRTGSSRVELSLLDSECSATIAVHYHTYIVRVYECTSSSASRKRYGRVVVVSL